MKLYNFSLLHPIRNIGDRMCSPGLYFDWLASAPVLSPDQWSPGEPSIWGGGGLFHPGTECWIEKACASGDKVVVWAAGLNYHDKQDQAYPAWLGSAGLVGLRDQGNPHRWLPCVSCMHKEFDSWRGESPCLDYVFYEHMDHLFAGLLDPDSVKANNECASIIIALGTMALGQVVVTNSFHGVYWALLLRRRPVIFEPFSNRFMAFKDVPTCTRDNWRQVVGEALVSYPVQLDLDECRQLNKQFSEEAQAYLST